MTLACYRPVIASLAGKPPTQIPSTRFFMAVLAILPPGVEVPLINTWKEWEVLCSGSPWWKFISRWLMVVMGNVGQTKRGTRWFSICKTHVMQKANFSLQSCTRQFCGRWPCLCLWQQRNNSFKEHWQLCPVCAVLQCKCYVVAGVDNNRVNLCCRDVCSKASLPQVSWWISSIMSRPMIYLKMALEPLLFCMRTMVGQL